ncbi:MAG: hypothetical protein QM639_12150 [Rhodocyclaceae bacterium]
MSIYGLDTMRNVLHAFADEAAAVAACPLAQAQAQEWLFFADDGEPLRPLPWGQAGAYTLRPWASCSSCRLEQVLPFVTRIEGMPGMTPDSVAHSLRRE